MKKIDNFNFVGNATTKNLNLNFTLMYLPYEIGDEVYFFKKYAFNQLQKGVIISITVSKNETIFEVEGSFEQSLTEKLRIDQIYPREEVAKEELLRRVVDYANEKIISSPIILN